MTVRIIEGDCRESLATLEPGSVQCCVVTSPPYFGLRDYGTAAWEGGSDDCEHKIAASTLGGGSNKGHAGSFTANYRSECGDCGAVRIDRQLGLESTPQEYVDKMVAVFREVRRVLRDDGTLWLNIGDSYAARYRQSGPEHAGALTRSSKGVLTDIVRDRPAGLKEKDLIGIPWMLAFALRADGWYLRSDIIWHKPNPMPESVTDRPTKSHEYLFLLSKSERYFYDADAIKEPLVKGDAGSQFHTGKTGQHQLGRASTKPRRSGNKERKFRQDYGGNPDLSNAHQGFGVPWEDDGTGRNRRSVWTIATQPYSGAHFATFPPALVEPCIKAGSSDKSCEHCGKAWERQVEKKSIDRTTLSPDDPRYRPQQYVGAGGDDAPYAMGQRRGMYSETTTLGFAPDCECGSVNPVPSTVLDPFGGAGTTGLVADRLNRNAILCELNPEYAELARKRIQSDNPLFTDVA